MGGFKQGTVKVGSFTNETHTHTKVTLFVTRATQSPHLQWTLVGSVLRTDENFRFKFKRRRRFH